MAKLTTYDYCKGCPHFRLCVDNCKTPEEFIALMNKDGAQTRCEHSDICDRVYQYVRERCKQC